MEGGSEMSDRPTRKFSQDGYAIVENRLPLPITLGFELTTWEAEKTLNAMRAKVGDGFFQEIQIISATLNFSLNTRNEEETK
jgi:hypothetical protein